MQQHVMVCGSELTFWTAAFVSYYGRMWVRELIENITFSTISLTRSIRRRWIRMQQYPASRGCQLMHYPTRRQSRRIFKLTAEPYTTRFVLSRISGTLNSHVVQNP